MRLQERYADPERGARWPEVIVCFSHLRWNFVYQRPQHLMSRAAAAALVYFVEEPVYERGATTPRLDRRSEANGTVTVCVPIFPEGASAASVAAAMRPLLDQLLAPHAGSRLTFWYYTPMALAFTDHLTPACCIYDCMDELSAFRGAPPEMTAREAVLFHRADLVFTGGRSLFLAKRDRHPRVHEFPSSIDAAHFAAARRRDQGEPPDQAALPRPRLGFFGVIDERMDLDLVTGLADLRPQWQLVMIGPVVKIDPATLPRRPNIHFLGFKQYDELPCYLRGWDIGFMPFAMNESTRYISPTKTPEFLAAGLPVLSTPIRDVVSPYGDHGLVEIAGSTEEFVARAEALLDAPRLSWLESVDSFLADKSWDQTWKAMHGLMRSTAPRTWDAPADAVAHV